MDRPQIEDSYPLLPLQQGMLFNYLYAPDSGVDIVQVVCALHEELQVGMFQRAWEQVVARHAILRTALRWTDVPEPMQEVQARVELPFVVHDWRDRAPEAWRAELEDCIRADRLRGFKLTEAPLLRLTLFQIDAAEYRCLLTFHHTILDGRSLFLLLQEAFADYEAQRQEQALCLEQPRPYHDYVAWVLQNDTSSAQGFWQNLLKGFTVPTALTLDRGLEPSSSAPAGYADQETRLSRELTTTLKLLAQEHDLTLNTLIQGAWALLLSNYSDQDDVVFGATRSCRRATVDGVDAMVGLFINTLPVRARMSPELPLLDWLKQLRSQHIAVRDYQHTSLAQVQQWSEVATGAPLFESIVVFENFLLHSRLRALGGGWNNREVDLRRQPNYPLSLCIFAEPQLIVKIVYDQSRFDAATIERMLGHFTTLLAGMVAQPAARLGALSLLTPIERLQLMPPMAAPLADRPLVPALVAGWAARTPEALALTAGTERLTYQQLEVQANQLAHLLRGLALPSEAVVALLLPRSVDWIVAQLAVLRAGYAFLPLDPAAPVARLRLQLATAAAALVLLTTAALPPDLAAACPVRCLDQLADALATLPTTPPDVSLHPEQLAYVIFTSGSTGVPKGVAVPHRGLASLVAWHHQTYAVTPQDRASQVAAQTFDAAVWEVWPYLTAGASLHLADEATRRDPRALGRWLGGEAISLSFVPTALAEALWTSGWRAPATVRALLVGGDQLHPVAEAQVGCALYNHYGPTETAVVATAGRVASGGGMPPIGVALPHVQAYVLNRWGQPVPAGVIGELYLGGAGVARGYLQQAGGTAEKFVPDPFSGEPGGRLYRTGDLVRWRADGQLAFIGRRDGQVQLRGLRIELGEIEAVLQAHAEVAEAVVIAHETAPNAKRLVAYVVENLEPGTQNREPDGEQRTENKEHGEMEAPPRLPQPKQKPAEVWGRGLGGEGLIKHLSEGLSSKLKQFLRERLPEYMIPASIVVLEHLPLTPNGKIDRRALDERALMESSEAAYVGPRTPVEAQLAAIWQQLLRPTNPAPIGIHDNFFALGGHSLLATQCVFQIQQTLHVDLPLRSLFNAPTIAECAEVIQAARATPTTSQQAIASLDRRRYRIKSSPAS